MIHGILVTGDTVAQAYRRLYKLERVCRTQMLALATGRPLEVLPEEIIARVQAPAPDDRRRLPVRLSGRGAGGSGRSAPGGRVVS